ncbi:hypothetical protein HJFPF1_02300 [Paramyrothecium foliicola]|nr:hypothetical protein HJFPF1_02300 [Paramyrothecium foliicola]
MVNSSLLTVVAALTQIISARPPPGRPDREQSHPCFPSDLDTVGGNADESLPPCVRQRKITEACGLDRDDGNLTSSEMHECVCNGSFFEDTIGCSACLAYQELISENDHSEESRMVSSASSAYCEGTDTADLASILNGVVTTETWSGSWAPGETPTTTKPTAISNYFTATAEQQGPGLESLVTERTTLTGVAPTAEPTDGGADTLSSARLAHLCLLSGAVAFLLS